MLPIFIFALISSCSSSDDSNDDMDLQLTPEEITVVLDAGTANEIVFDNLEPVIPRPCGVMSVTADSYVQDNVELDLSAIDFPDPGFFGEYSLMVGESLLLDEDFIFPDARINIDGAPYVPVSGNYVITDYDTSRSDDFIYLVSGTADLVLSEIGGSQTHTISVTFTNLFIGNTGAVC